MSCNKWLVPKVGEKTTIRIDDTSVQVIGGARSVKIIGVLPGNVSAAKMTAGFQGRANFEAMILEIEQAELKKLAEDLAGTLATALKWREVHS